MEFIGELLLGFIVEVVLPVIAEIAFEFLWHCLGQPFVSRERRNGIFAGIGYFLIGLILGGLSLLVFPQSFARSENFHGISLLVTPVTAGLVMSAIGRWRLRQGKTLLRLDSFIYGFVFAFPIALVRFVHTI